MRNGYTLIELVVVLVLLAATLALGAPRLLAFRDALRTRAAREAVVGRLEQARGAGVARGSAELELRADSDLVRVRWGSGGVAELDVMLHHGVELSLGGGRAAARIEFGRLGLGRVASRTVHLHRGADTSSFAISTFGRVRRW